MIGKNDKLSQHKQAKKCTSSFFLVTMEQVSIVSINMARTYVFPERKEQIISGILKLYCFHWNTLVYSKTNQNIVHTLCKNWQARILERCRKKLCLVYRMLLNQLRGTKKSSGDMWEKPSPIETAQLSSLNASSHTSLTQTPKHS